MQTSAVAAVLEVVAHKIGVPHPALLVLGGLALALTPGLPRVEMDPETLFGSQADYLLEVAMDEPDTLSPERNEMWRLLVLEDTGELLTPDAKANENIASEARRGTATICR